ncbi:MAG: TonB-dependent receptor [Flavobacterium sp.]
MKCIFLIPFFLLSTMFAMSQNTISGTITADFLALPNANVVLQNSSMAMSSDHNGKFTFENVPAGEYELVVSYLGFRSQKKKISLRQGLSIVANFNLKEDNDLDEVVITGTMKAVTRMESAVPVEVYKSSFFKKNPTANIFEGLQNVNGVRPQLNCNICNTGDIHINGLEGPYTLVLIDGMPIVSGLSTVYGLSGIPNSLLDRIEIVKGPASSLYGSEAVGGLINIITKNPISAPIFSADIFGTSWGEVNVDLGFKANVTDRISFLTGVNYFNYSNPIDNNHDNFTDVTLQDRLSVFQKFNFERANNKLFSVAGRFFYEDRWGGEMNFNRGYRGGDEVYGESIYTKRWEVIGAYELPIAEKMLLSFSYTDHDQNSFYGDIPYRAQQKIGFTQLTWDKELGNHDLLFGAAARYQYYNDNTTATETAEENWIPGIFVQDEIKFSDKHSILLGARYDYNDNHGSIFTPRFAYKWKLNDHDILRFNAGTGFRIVNIFTEEHAALTGARDVEIVGDLKPEQSYNANINFLKKMYADNGTYIGFEAAAWFTYFTNQITPDYDTDPNKIIYENLNGNAITKGISANADVVFNNGLKFILGATYMIVDQTQDGIKTNQILTEKFSGTWAISYRIKPWNVDIDYTGNAFGPMRLPLLGDLDPRSEYSKTYSIQNIQFTFDKIKNFEIYGGVKNILNWTPNKGNPFIIARANDPFDKDVTYNNDGSVMATPGNPYALTFDPNYVYGPNQGIRTFIGLRYSLQ